MTTEAIALAAARERRRSRTAARRMRRLASVVLLAVAWEVTGMLMSSLFVPKLSTTVVAFSELITSGRLLEAFQVSLPAFVIGYALAIVVGNGLGILMGLVPRFRHAMDVHVTIMLATPMAAFVPVIVIFFGLSIAARITVVFLFSAVYMAVTSMSGVRSARTDLVEMGRSFRLSRWRIFRSIILPSAAPMIMAGIRLGYGRALVGLLVSELILSSVGIGEMLLFQRGRLYTDEMFGTIFAILAFAMAGGSLILALDRRVNRWRYAA